MMLFKCRRLLLSKVVSVTSDIKFIVRYEEAERKECKKGLECSPEERMKDDVMKGEAKAR